MRERDVKALRKLTDAIPTSERLDELVEEAYPLLTRMELFEYTNRRKGEVYRKRHEGRVVDSEWVSMGPTMFKFSTEKGKHECIRGRGIFSHRFSVGIPGVFVELRSSTQFAPGTPMHFSCEHYKISANRGGALLIRTKGTHVLYVGKTEGRLDPEELKKQEKERSFKMREPWVWILLDLLDQGPFLKRSYSEESLRILRRLNKAGYLTFDPCSPETSYSLTELTQRGKVAVELLFPTAWHEYLVRIAGIGKRSAA